MSDGTRGRDEAHPFHGSLPETVEQLADSLRRSRGRSSIPMNSAHGVSATNVFQFRQAVRWFAFAAAVAGQVTPAAAQTPNGGSVPQRAWISAGVGRGSVGTLAGVVTAWYAPG